MPFKLIFVMDISNGVVVHGVRGERDNYKPISEGSKIVENSDPLEIMGVVKAKEVYIADLDRIMERGDNFSLIKKISNKAEVMADIGVRSLEDVEIGHKYASKIVLGTETIHRKVIDEDIYIDEDLVSMDLRGKELLCGDPKIPKDPKEFLSELDRYDLDGIIVLFIDRVGTGSGMDLEFLEELRGMSVHPMIFGGGIEGLEDLDRLKDIGMDGALVATAIHNGKIPLDLLR